MKIGRNDPCPCDSGKKYKKCCLGKEQQLSSQGSKKTSESKTICTTTGEYLYPVRLYYSVADTQALHKLFQSMKCMQFDADSHCWFWVYEEEAIGINLKKAHNEVPKELYPILLGSFSLSEDDKEMYFDTRSIERAAEAILFFDEYIDTQFASVTHAAIRHRFIRGAEEAGTIDYDKYFPASLDKALQENTEQTQKLLANFKDSSINNEMDKKIYPEAEKFPLHFYEEGIERLYFKAAESFIVAKEWEDGNKQVCFADVMARMFQ